LLPFKGQASDQLSERLGQVPGVEEVVIVESESTAYLKVQSRRVDREALERVVEQWVR